jgi:hypothetical protein
MAACAKHADDRPAELAQVIDLVRGCGRDNAIGFDRPLLNYCPS